MVMFWNSISEIATSCRKSGYLEIPIQGVASATPKGQAGKQKYTKLIQCFPENDDDYDYRINCKNDFNLKNYYL